MKECKENSWIFLSSSPINLSFFECEGTSGHTLGLFSNRSFWVGVLCFHVISMMIILVIHLSG
jgi:hypothetical protein